MFKVNGLHRRKLLDVVCKREKNAKRPNKSKHLYLFMEKCVYVMV